LVVCAEGPASPVPMNRVHISRRACARVITRARAREGEDPPTSGGSLELAFGHFGEEAKATMPVDSPALVSLAALLGQRGADPESIAKRGVGSLFIEPVAVRAKARQTVALAIAGLLAWSVSGIDGGDGVEVIGV